MKQFYNLLIIAFLLPIGVIANPVKGKYTKKKSIKKSYTVNDDAMLLLNNKYGSMTITTWDQSQIEIEVYVEVTGDDEDDVVDKLKEIDVQFDASASRVSARTYVERNRGGWKSWFGGSKNVSMEINYVVKMPATNDLDASNDYGTLSLDKLIGHAKLSCDYGRVEVGELLHDNNYIKMDYTNKSAFDYIKSATINADYSSLTVNETENIDLKADYTHSEFKKINKLNVNTDYGSITAGEVDELIGRGDYVSFKIGTLNRSLDLNTDYGSIHVGNLNAGFKTVTIRSDFTGVNLKFDPSASFSFDINTEFAGISLSDSMTVIRSDKDYTDKTKEGYHGSKESGNTVNINSSYGGVKLKSN